MKTKTRDVLINVLVSVVVIVVLFQIARLIQKTDAAVWTGEIPKSNPNKVKYLVSIAEEQLRNCPSCSDNSCDECLISKAYKAEGNKYLRNWRSDVDGDGKIDRLDTLEVASDEGIDARPLKENAKFDYGKDPNIVSQPQPRMELTLYIPADANETDISYFKAKLYLMGFLEVTDSNGAEPVWIKN
jgi:hypothetical protein